MLTKLGPFQILEVIGRGGMGTVYRGIDPIIGRAVAVKVIRLIGYNDQDEQIWLKERLFREARAAGNLCHPSIVTIFQVGEEQDVAYIAMEFVDGPTLEAIMAKTEPLDKATICRVLGEAASALDHAHQWGLVHRDIKPANIMVTAAGTTKVTDFGIAKTTFGETTKTGMILGTPCYMSPEQVLGQPLDGRSDQFALAVVAYEMLTGQRPFRAENPTSICYQIIHEEPLSPELVNPSVGAGVSAVLKKGLAKEAGGRYSTCSEFAQALLAGVNTPSEERRAVEPAAAPRPNPPSEQTTTFQPPLPPPRPAVPAGRKASAKPLWVPAAFVFAAALIGIWFTWVKLSTQRSTPLAAVQSSATVSPSPSPAAAVLETAEKPARDVPLDRVTAIAPAPAAAGQTEPARSPAVPEPPDADVAKLPEQAKPHPGSESRAAPPEVIKLRKGIVVWTGHFASGGLLTIAGSRASTGSLSGALPGTPVSVQVYPAEAGRDGLTVFTSNPRYATPAAAKTAAGNAIFTFDPRHATDIVVFESPGAQNNWERLVVRINNSKISACVIEWQAQ